MGHTIADLATEIECVRLLVYDVAAEVDIDPDRQLPRKASMAKLKATEVAKQRSDRRHADDGRLRLCDRVRHGVTLRATIISTVYGGTSEIQRDIICKTYGL